MGARDFGPIPRGVWDLEGYVLASREARGVYLAILGICSYRGRFSRAPHLLARAIADDDWRSLEPVLCELEGLGLVQSWTAPRVVGNGSPQSGEPVGSVRVACVVGYLTLDGLPKDRRNKAPKAPEYPGPEHALPTGSPVTPHTLPGDSPLGKGSRVKGSEENPVHDMQPPVRASAHTHERAHEAVGHGRPSSAEPAPAGSSSLNKVNGSASTHAHFFLPGSAALAEPSSTAVWRQRTPRTGDMRSVGELLGNIPREPPDSWTGALAPCWHTHGFEPHLIAFCNAAAQWYTQREEALHGWEWYWLSRERMDAVCRNGVGVILMQAAQAVSEQSNRLAPLEFLEMMINKRDPAHRKGAA